MWQFQGSIVDHEYQIGGPAGKVGEMAKRRFRIADIHEVAPGQVDAPVVAVTIVVDATSHSAR